MKVTVCDCIPGAGKTEAAITMMKRRPDRKYLFVTPYTNECKRIIASCPSLDFKTPDEKGKFYTKSENLLELLAADENIVHTHQLFAYYTDETRELIKEHGYVLVLDEVMNVVEKESVSRHDIQMLFDSGVIEMEEDGFHVRWLKDDYNGGFAKLKKKAELHNLFYVKNQLLFWSVPVRSFESFEDIYVLTYLFQAQVQRYYYEINGIEFDYIGVRQTEAGFEFGERGELPAYARDLINRVNILEDKKLNRVGDSRNGLSLQWFRVDMKSGGKQIKVLKNAIYNVMKNRFHAKVGEALWTTYKETATCIAPARYDKQFLPWNMRATNDYRHCTCLAYCVNVFLSPGLKIYLGSHGACVDEDAYALSEMVQWVWRSAIRCGGSINIYVPSSRMRGLLRCWLEALAAAEDPIERWQAKKAAERAVVQPEVPVAITPRVLSRRRRARREVKQD